MLGDNLKRIRKERGFTQEDVLAVEARFRTGSHPRPEELKPNQTQRCTLTVSRTENGKWTVTDWSLPSD